VFLLNSRLILPRAYSIFLVNKTYGTFFVADPGSGIWCLFESRIRNSFFPYPGSRDSGYQTHVFESLVIIFWTKSTKILCKLAQTFLLYRYPIQRLIIMNFFIFVSTKKVGQQIFHPLLLLLLDPRSGSGIRDGYKSGSGINNPDPQHCFPSVIGILKNRFFRDGGSEVRKEKSRDAARCRRAKESDYFQVIIIIDITYGTFIEIM
jgi:hypothetical protein